MLVKDEQFINAHSPKETNEEGRVTLVSPLQLVNVSQPIVVTALGIVTLFSPEHL